MARSIDHIVFCVPDLEEGVNKFKNLLGIAPVIGGKHLTKGTKNALFNLGNQCYFEILAADFDNAEFEGQRWMGIDILKGAKITRWSLKTNDIKDDSKLLNDYEETLGHIEKGSRQTTEGKLLAWRMTLPTAHPEVDVVPFVTDWSNSESHPTETLEELCRLQSVVLYHPNPTPIQSLMNEMNVACEIRKGNAARIEITIDTPKGVVYIS